MFQKILQLIKKKKKNRIKKISIFYVDFNHLDPNDILDIHKYFMKKYDIKQSLGYLKSIYGILISIVNASNNLKRFVEQSEMYDLTYSN